MNGRSLYFFIVILGVCSHVYAQGSHAAISVDFEKKGAAIGPMYGVFYEEINHAGEGGMYAELLRNRSFEDNILVPTTKYKDGYMIAPHLLNYYPPRAMQTGGYSDFAIKFDTSALQGWKLVMNGGAGATVRQTDIDPKYSTAPHNLELSIRKAGGKGAISLVNSGFSGFMYNTDGKPYLYNVANSPTETEPFGIAFDKNEQYRCRLIVKAAGDYKGAVTVKLISRDGKVLASHLAPVKKGNGWKEYTCLLQPSETVNDGRFSLSFDASGTVWVDFASLMPVHSFGQRANGLRKDIATMIADLKPAFIRWPGGCIVEGLTLANRFKWKETLGDPAGRPGEFDLWGYRNSYGFGYHEFLQYCEDIGTDAMFVCNVGLSCMYRNGDYCNDDDVPNYIQDALDAIEYAIGDVTTPWGAKRAAAGHPGPFPLKYIEVGNENRFQVYADRFDLFYKAIKDRYPQINIIADYSFEEVKAYRAAKRPLEMIDPHWYVDPAYFYENHHLFDSVMPRPKYKIYVGEYAANQDVGNGSMDAALSEAAFATGMERNADLINMCSYAPLLQHDKDATWSVNMILFNTDKVFGRSSYYVQKMLSENKPTVNLSTDLRDGVSAPYKHYVIAGFDEKTNEIVLKVVNGEGSPFETSIDIKNAGILGRQASVTTLAAQSASDENSFDAPKKISPKPTSFSNAGDQFDYSFLPYSFTVIRIKKG